VYRDSFLKEVAVVTRTHPATQELFMRRSPGLVSLLALSVLLAGCGTQVGDGRRQALARQQLLGSTAGQSTGGESGAFGVTTGGPTLPGSGPTSLGTNSGTSGSGARSDRSGTSTSPGSPRGGSTGGSGTSGAGASTAGNAVPLGGNGGATDKGVTANSILIGNVSDLSGPQPGLFKTAIAGTNAYLAYVNSTGGLYGRQLKIDVADSQTSCDGDRAGQEQTINDVFAYAGSFSLFDQCGATVLKQHPDVPDAHLAVTPDANRLPNNFSVNPVGSTINNGIYAWATAKFGKSVVENTGFMYVNLPAVTNVAALQRHSAESAGWKFGYTRAVGATETDFTADIIQMRQKGIKNFVTLFNADEMANFKQQSDQQSFAPVMMAPLVYDQTFFTKLGGSAAAENIYGSTASTLFFSPEDAARIPSVALFQKWYAKVSGGAAADTFAADAWAETALLVQAMRAAGPRLTRKATLAELAKITSFDADKFFAPANPAAKKPGNCYVIFQIKGGKYLRVDTPASTFRCDGVQA
jgi:ABC-type branched-subunit amino acid transport system substrate-binding protein